MKIYLAGPWFKKEELWLYEKMIKKMKSQGLDVYIPRDAEVHSAWDMSEDEWSLKVFQADVEAIKECDEVWVLNYGMYSDSGTAWEAGFAYGIGKVVRQLVWTLDDVVPEFENVFSLMMINGSDEVVNLPDYLNDTNNEVGIKQK